MFIPASHKINRGVLEIFLENFYYDKILSAGVVIVLYDVDLLIMCRIHIYVRVCHLM